MLQVEETLTPPEIATLQNVEKRLKQLSAAELELDKTLFILKWYFMYPQWHEDEIDFVDYDKRIDKKSTLRRSRRCIRWYVTDKIVDGSCPML